MDENNSFPFTTRLKNKLKNLFHLSNPSKLSCNKNQLILTCICIEHQVLSYLKFNRKNLQLQKYMSNNLKYYLKILYKKFFSDISYFSTSNFNH